MAQSLLIGLGGTGSRVVNNVVKELHKNGQTINNGQMCCAVLDTNVNDNESIVASNTGIPVFPTSKAKKIRDYLEDYHHLHMEDWCPISPAFLEESTIDGCSELRIKSRIAFMDCVETGVTKDLELLINEVLKNGNNSKIRIMIVSSLSGGTGSGMFIQVALWLRKFLSQSQITIRGIFLLPDVFVSTIKDIRDNKATAVRHYCNAYAAVKELNAISKIRKSDTLNLSHRIVLDNLFDSDVDKDSGKGVYDFAFFVDDKDERGVRLDSIGDYERMVAQLVYMQLYAPMKDDMYSEEDNAFLSFVENDEPLYGSCGTAKAVYPVDSVKMYCAIRATQDALSSGWKKIDDEIDAIKREREENEKEGVFSREALDERAKYIKLFDDKADVDPETAGKDRFFLSIAKDTKNERRRKTEEDKIVVTYTDKVADFIKLIKTEKIDPLALRYGGTDDFALIEDDFVAEDHTKEQLLDQILSDESGLEEAVNSFEARVEEFAETIIGTVFPYSMGDIKANNKCSVYGLLTKENAKKEIEFIHPVAARYVLYKLVAELEKGLKSIVLSDSKAEALSGGDINTLFDNSATKETENEAKEFLLSKKWYQKEAAFFDDFEHRYAQFITGKIALCEKFEKECLQARVYTLLIKRANELIKQLEAFFRKLSDVQVKLDDALEKNIAQTDGVVGKTVYVYAGKEAKEKIYGSVDLEQDRSNNKINKGVIDAAYGRVCAEKRPGNPENAKYAQIGITTAFVKETLDTFKNRIEKDAENKENVELDIYTAVCKESDMKVKKLEDAEEENRRDSLDDFDFESGKIQPRSNAKAQRHRAAFSACKDTLLNMSAPLLIHDKEITDNELGTLTMRDKTFWGFNPNVTQSCPFIGSVLGVNADLQQDTAYPASELYCYRAVYGLEAVYIPKFNETKDGMYYKCYRAIVDDMAREAEGKKGERALVRTPHLDKYWHKYLPYITPQMQMHGDMDFFLGLLLAFAYGRLRLNQENCFVIRRAVSNGYDSSVKKDVSVLHNDKPVKSTDIQKLIEALKTDKIFSGADIPELMERYHAELEDMVTYEGTDVFKGLTSRGENFHPVTVIVRYNESRGHDFNITATMIGALEKIAADLAEHYNTERSQAKITEAKWGILRRIYDSAKRTVGKEELFDGWLEEFVARKIKSTKFAEDDSNE